MEVVLMHIYAETKTGKLLGAELIARDGEHLAHLLAWAIAAGWSAPKTLSMPFYHPLVEEGMRSALRNVQKQIDIAENQIELFKCPDPTETGNSCKLLPSTTKICSLKCRQRPSASFPRKKIPCNLGWLLIRFSRGYTCIRLVPRFDRDLP